jgi:hypothetical protein
VTVRLVLTKMSVFYRKKACFLNNDFFKGPEIALMRQNRESYYYKNFLKRLVQCVVGKREFSRLSHHQLLHNYCSISDEACAHLFYENNGLKWDDMASSGNHKSSEVVPKYTNGGNSTGPNASSRKFGGWSNSGYTRYNELYLMIARDRASPMGRLFDEQFQLHMMEDYLENTKNSKKNGRRTDSLDVAEAPVDVICHLFPNSNLQGMERAVQKITSYEAVGDDLGENSSSTSNDEELSDEVESEDENEEDDASLGMQAVPLSVSSATNFTAL